MKTQKKKGEMTFDILFFSLMFFMIGALFMVVLSKTSTFIGDFGGPQTDILNTYYEAEKALFFVDQSAKYSAKQAIYDLGQKGGFQEVSDCGYYHDYVLWNDEDQECYPDVKNAFYSIIDLNLNDYIKKYPIIPQNNYDYLIKESDDSITFYGFAARDIELDVKRREKEEEKIEGEIIPEKPEETGVFIWPLDKTPSHQTITSCFGLRDCDYCASKYHTAIDIRANNGDKVFAAADGTVEYVGGASNKVIIRHDSYETHYLHNSKIFVEIRDYVKQGDIIAAVGGYGKCKTNNDCATYCTLDSKDSCLCINNGCNSKYPSHLDFRVKKAGQFLDPLTLYDRTSLGIKYNPDANCVYWSNQYAYKEEIEGNMYG